MPAAHGPSINLVDTPPDYSFSEKLDFLNDDRLSWRARGILSWILSKRPPHGLHLSEVVEHSPDGIHAVRMGLVELHGHGYITLRRGKVILHAIKVLGHPE